MSQEFKIRFEENKESVKPESQETGISAHNYVTIGHIRNIGFVWPDGKIQFFNYSYLISCSFSPVDNKIELEFSTHTVNLKGYRLEPLAYDLLAHIPRIIVCSEERYNSIEDTEKSIVNEISVVTK